MLRTPPHTYWKKQNMHYTSITLKRGEKSSSHNMQLSCKIFFIVKTESTEVDDANVITEHFPLVPEFARFWWTRISPLALLRFHGHFEICCLIICIYCLETKVHLILNKKTAGSLFHISYREIYRSQIPSQFNGQVSALTKPQNSPPHY